ncbi:MAG: hypothetical protein H0W15_11655 [Gemmatimonadales bacterium]|nr:hypothetical protein [Gemmatimonadales bacterium]
MPRITALLLLASAAGVLACADGSPTEPSAHAGSAPALARGATPSRPAGGECRSQFEFLSETQILIQLDCNLRHLGRTTGTSTQTITFTGQTSTGQLTAVLTASPVYTAANGDMLNASFTGTAIVDPAAGAVSFTGTETFSGGTGRFSDASGSVAVSGTASLITNSGSYITTGSLTY